MADLKYLACSDIQFPLHDPRAVELWMKVLKKFQPDLVDLVGDLDNSDSVSRWAVGHEKLAPVSDDGARDTQSFLADIRATLPNADCHLFDGNHGWTRHEKYLKENAPQYMEFVSADTLYKYSDSGFTFHAYSDLPTNRFHDMYVHHGQAISKHAGGSVQADMDSWGVSLIRGHSHRIGSYRKTFELTGRALEGYEIGHLMDIKQADYSNQRNWQQGFIYGFISETDHHLTLVQIKDNVCYVDGKRFQS